MIPKIIKQAATKDGKIVDGLTEYQVEVLLQTFWERGGKEKYKASKAMRDVNGIPDSQWFKANLMDIIDNAEITYEPD